MHNNCPQTADQVFGPAVSCPHVFDFTLLFEQSIFSIGPSVLFLLLLPLRVWNLHGKTIKTTKLGNNALWLKLTLAGSLIGIQIATLTLWAQDNTVRTAIPSAILSLLDALLITILSVIEHSRSVRPSTLICLYLLISIPLDSVQVRTLFLRSNYPSALAGTLAAAVGLKVFLLSIEIQRKERYLSDRHRYPPEELSGIFSRTVFSWLTELFLKGFRKILTLDDLFPTDNELDSNLLMGGLKVKWAKYKSSNPLSIIYATVSCLRWALLRVVVPRLCLIGFSYAQTFFIERAITLLHEPATQDSKNDGYGLIGAAALIYGGIAISTVHYQHQLFRMITMFRGAFVALIYDYSMTLREGQYNESAAITHMSTDVDMIARSLEQANELWARILEISIGIWLLERQLGAVCIAPVLVIIGCNDLRRYREVLHACALEDDLATMSNGDESLVGSQGIILSGGQKQRLALARALYSKKQFLVLDNALSAVDHHTEHIILERVFGGRGLCRDSGMSVLMTTHSKKYLGLAHEILVLNAQGHVVKQGPFVPSLLADQVTEFGESDTSESLDRDSSITQKAVTVPKTLTPEIISDMSRQTGDIAVYSYYLRAIGWRLVLGACLIILVYTFSANFPQVWLDIFTNDNGGQPGRFIGIHVLLMVAASGSQGLMIWQIMINIVVRSGLALHGILVRAVMNAPMQVFAEVDSGVILNRFSQDMTLVDAVLPTVTFGTFLGKYASRSGYGYTFLYGFKLVSVFIANSGCTISTDPGKLGVSLTAIMAFNQSLQELVTSWTAMETSLGAISRTRSFELNTANEHLSGENFVPPPEWPSHGKVELRSVYASYDGTRDVLDNINITIEAGERIGICGRTGSGKSTLLSLLLRLIDHKAGTIRIDDIDIATIPRNILRSRLIAVPQDPLPALPGYSIRHNIDPNENATDTMILGAIKKVGLLELVESRGGLYGEDFSSQPLSQGEQKLFALARALISKWTRDSATGGLGGVLILDEFTGGTDAETERSMLKIIEEEFSGYTIIQITHQIDAITSMMDYDYHGLLASAPEPDFIPEEKSNCKDGCCDGSDAEPLNTTAPGHEEPAQEHSDDGCSPGNCSDDKIENDIDAPDCCRGKPRPCCDTSCLDRLAMRECAMSAAATPGLNTCGEATVDKPCSQHSLSALDRYGATLQALGCICRTLIALGQEACCELRERPVLDKKQCSSSRSSSSRSLNRTSLDLCSGSVTKHQAAQNRLCPPRGSSESIIFTNKSSVDASVVSSCSKDKPAKCSKPYYSDGTPAEEPRLRSNCAASCCEDDNTFKEVPSKNKRSCSCCSEDTPAKDNCAKSMSALGKPAKQPVAQIGCVGSCCSESPHVEEQPPEAGCPRNQRVSDNDTKSIYTDSYCSKVKPVVELPTSGCAGSCCGKAKNMITTTESSKAASSGHCYKPPKQDVLKTPKTSCAKPCCTEQQPVSPQGSCADACCSFAVPNPEKVPIQPTTDVENQGTGKEHVVLSISGMTCTGCETKLNRTLVTVPAVKDLKTSLVLSRAEFTIDLSLSTVEEVIKYLERTTEFKYERVQNQGSSLDIIIPDEPSKFISQTWPDGVIDMSPIDKQTVRVAFDPKIVGARDLTEKIWRPSIELAPHGDPSLKAGSKHVRHVGYMTLLSAILTIPVLVMAWAPLPKREVTYSSASLTLATIIQVVIAGPFYPKALKALIFSRVIEMDLLIVLSTSAAYIFSVVSFGYLIAGKSLSTGQFFETSTLLVTLIMLGRWIAALARQRAVESISIRSLQASAAILIDKESGTEREIDARLLQYGDTFKVLPDTRIPTDGTVIHGSSEVDESMLTGESRPVEKYPMSVVIAGSINGPGVIIVRLNRLPSDNTINTIAAMVDEAKLSKPKLQALADRVASYFVPVVVTLTIITFVIWVAVGMTIRGYDGSKATTQAITYAITVLIVSCPCAIGLAVPMVIVIASGSAAERGIIFKSADAIEVAHKTSHVVFDKTGTLTRGKLSVVAKDYVDEDKLPLLLGLIENSRHPVSVSVAAHLKDTGVVAATVPEPKSLAGKGIETTLDGRRLRAGNSRWLGLLEHELVQPMLDQGYTVFCFTIDDVVQAVYGLEDELRPDAAATINTLQKRGISVHMVSGDDDGAVQILASKLNIPGDNVRSRSSPADKKRYIQTLLGTGADHKKPVVVFCGDGTNDAVALAQATIGVHINEGTDVAQSAADVVLMRPFLAGIPSMMNASQNSINRIKLNFIWSFVYNTFAILLAAGAFVNVRIPPEFAGLGELLNYYNLNLNWNAWIQIDPISTRSSNNLGGSWRSGDQYISRPKSIQNFLPSSQETLFQSKIF
ncbi:Cu2+-exporting ATPase [Talaromyces islandicus]|uniref:Cu2+-exporting ATPase n=1 Tax=Talaromyces islandicus TaxID=28573 RepID=A0A0U1LW68_TALIS|nr:Cu2+-exporting ATPase [Talaromyces islandicus]